MAFRNGYYRDIEYTDIYPPVGTAVVVVFVIACIILFSTAVDIKHDNKTIEAHNLRATEFNARPEAEREIIAPYLGEEVDGEHCTVALQDGIVDLESFLYKEIIGALIIMPIILSIITAVSYIMEKSSYYYLADLPFHKLYGWVLFFSLFVIWPALLVSRLRMRKARAKLQSQEDQAVEAIAKQELKDEADARSSYRSKLTRKAKNRYVVYRIKGYKEAHRHRKAELEKKISDKEAELRQYSSYIQGAQREIGATKAQLNELEKVNLSEGIARKEAIEEWRLISEMRGVSKITLHGDAICILVKVRVPYLDHVYDFGDYEIRIKVDGYSCKRVRSGIKLNATNRMPNYNESSGFCFGNRSSTISDYIQHARMLEAITLMIDCLHSVNGEEAERNIPNCFRRVEVIESAKRRLEKRQKSSKEG